MSQPHHPHLVTRLTLGALLVIIVLSGGLMLALAQESDGRINTRDHVGGAAVYCVNAALEPAAHWTHGGIRVLNAEGQELLFAPADVIEAAGDPPAENTLVGDGANAFGPLTLYVRTDNKFQLNGTDEHGKAFEFIWGGCSTAAPSAPADVPAPTPTCPPLPIGRLQAAVGPTPSYDPCLYT